MWPRAWSSDLFSSDLPRDPDRQGFHRIQLGGVRFTLGEEIPDGQGHGDRQCHHVTHRHVRPGRIHAIGLVLLGRVVTERSEEHTSELQSRGQLVCSLLLEEKKMNNAALTSRNNE